MKRTISLILAVFLLLCTCGCVSQKDVDTLNSRIAELEGNLSEAQSKVSGLNDDLSDANKTISELEKEKTDLTAALENSNQLLETAQNSAASLEAELTALQTELDELKNGPDRTLAAIRTAYENKNWKDVVSLANTLHSKYPGLDQDIEGQKLAASAQKTLDDLIGKWKMIREFL